MTKNLNDKTAALVVLKSIQEEAAPLLKKLQKLLITDLDSYNKASQLAKQLKVLAKIADEKEKSLTVPLTQVVADIRDLFRPFKEEVKQMEEATKGSMLLFIEKQNKQIKKVEEDLASGKIKKVSTAVAKQAELQVVSASSQVRKIWKAIEVDAKLTPKEYLMPNIDAIKEALKAGKEVKGWKWEQVDSIAI